MYYLINKYRYVPSNLPFQRNVDSGIICQAYTDVHKLVRCAAYVSPCYILDFLNNLMAEL